MTAAPAALIGVDDVVITEVVAYQLPERVGVVTGSAMQVVHGSSVGRPPALHMEFSPDAFRICLVGESVDVRPAAALDDVRLVVAEARLVMFFPGFCRHAGSSNRNSRLAFESSCSSSAA